jgi:ankyrin repeat protein
VHLRARLLEGDHAGLAQALDAGADPNARLPDGSLPLAWAAELQDADALRLLLDHGAAPDDSRAGANDFAPLLVACLHPDAAVLDALLDAGADVTATARDGLPVLAACAGSAPARIVERMLDAGAPVDSADADGQTPLMWAAAHGRTSTFEVLVTRGADVNRSTAAGFTPLFFAIRSGDAGIAARALAAGGDVTHRTPDGTTALQLALYQDNTGFARQLVEHGAPGVDLAAVDLNGRLPLHAAVLSGDEALVAVLLAAGADVNAITGPSSVEWRFESNFRAGRYEWPARSALALAAEQGRPALMRTLAAAGADPAWRDDSGDTLVHLAVASGMPEALEAALSLTPDADVPGARGDTPLHRALKRVTGSALDAMLATLARHGARTDIANEAGETPADIAADEHFKGRTIFASLFTTSEDSGP